MFQADQVQPIITTTDDSGDDCDYQHKPRCRIHTLDCRIRPGETPCCSAAIVKSKQSAKPPMTLLILQINS